MPDSIATLIDKHCPTPGCYEMIAGNKTILWLGRRIDFKVPPEFTEHIRTANDHFIGNPA